MLLLANPNGVAHIQPRAEAAMAAGALGYYDIGDS